MRNPLSTFAEALFSAPQRSEVKTRNGGVYYQPGEVDTVPVPENIGEEIELYKETPLIAASFLQFADDVVEPGARVTADNSTTEDWLNDDFLPNAGIVAGKNHQDFGEILHQSAVMHEAGGKVLTEHVKKDPNASEPTITGFMLIPIESVAFQTRENRPILLEPDADGTDVAMTKRGEAAAYLQYHETSPYGRLGKYSDKDVVKLSQNDVTDITRNPLPGQLWGLSATHTVKDRTVAMKQKLKDNEQAIRSKAHGIWSVGFGRDVVEGPDGSTLELIEWSDQDQEDFLKNKIGRDMGPGDIIGHDGAIEFEKFEGEIADGLLDFLEFDVKYIVSALPTPLYAVGWESNINQFVTERQETRYDKQVRDLRRTLESAYTSALESVAESHGYETSGIQLHIEAEEDESPIRSLDDDVVERFVNYTQGLKNVYGDKAYKRFDDEQFVDLVAQLPEEALVDEEETSDSQVDPIPPLDEEDEQVQTQFANQNQGQQAVADGGQEMEEGDDAE